MQINSRHCLSRLSIVPLMCGGLLLFAGCGTSAYEATMARTLSEANRLTPFAALYDQPITIPETGVQVRIPKLFDTTSASYAPGSTSVRDSPPDGEKVVDPKRLHPSFLTIPGLKTTYEAYMPTGNTNMPMYCYLAVQKKAAPGPEAAQALEKDLTEKLKSKFPDKDPKWEEVTATSPDLTPEGGTKTLTWKKLAIKAPQDFDTGTPGSPQFYERDTQFELWMLDGESEIVLIGWSVPDLLGTNVSLPSLSLPVAGTVIIGAEPAPDAAAGA
jgi:hypothetical protein